MIVLGSGLKLIQESRADSAAAKLKAMISVTATVIREGCPLQIPVAHLVPGDVVQLSAGDMIPGDVKVIEAKDLFVSQGTLTGETFPVEKFVDERSKAGIPLELTSIAFLGTSVESGSAIAVVVATGAATYLGGMAQSLQAQSRQTAFDKGISQLTWLMVWFILVMVPIVFLINGCTKGSWSNAFFFAVAVAVGLTPEMLPMIVTANLARGAIAMAKQLSDGQVEYEDGTPSTEFQMAKDVASFLAWTAEPEHDDRKKWGMQWLVAITTALAITGFYKRFRWSIYKTRKISDVGGAQPPAAVKK
jgi:Mg2+-importing ATPase